MSNHADAVKIFTASLKIVWITWLKTVQIRDGWIMREKFANYAQRFYRFCVHFLPIVRKLCALFANYAQIMRNDFKDYAQRVANN